MIITNFPETADRWIGRPKIEAVDSVKIKKKRLGKRINGHFRRISLIVANVLLNYDWFFTAVGSLNRRWHFLEAVFVVFPAYEAYANAYVYPRFRHIMRWIPWPACVFRQNGKWGLMMVISSTENDFVDPKNEENLKLMVEKTEKIRLLVGASQKTFAGNLPSILYKKGIIKEAVEAEVTTDAVNKAEAELRKAENYPPSVPVIVLGGKGFIGTRMVRSLCSDGRQVYSVESRQEWPSFLKGQKCIVINLTKKEALSSYLDLCWPELLVLNEVYPEPTRIEITTLTKIGVSIYHVVGVVAKAYPQLPKAYEGGIPCCGARKCEDMEVIIRKLN